MGTEKSKPAEKKVMDVSRPSQVAAPPTSRPVIVTNRPLITQDPMVMGGENTEAAKAVETKQSAAVTPHAEKVIKPLKDQGTDSAPETEEGKSKKETEPFTIGTQENADELVTKKPESERVASNAESTASDLSKTPDEAKRSADAATEPSKTEDAERQGDETGEGDTGAEITSNETSTEEIAGGDGESTTDTASLTPEEQKRTEEIEAAIASGRYFVPINASGKRRTLIVTVWLVILTVVLAVILVDALLDVGMLTLQGVPHTRFFSLT